LLACRRRGKGARGGVNFKPSPATIQKLFERFEREARTVPQCASGLEDNAYGNPRCASACYAARQAIGG
jgi:hypothetical protein